MWSARQENLCQTHDGKERRRIIFKNAFNLARLKNVFEVIKLLQRSKSLEKYQESRRYSSRLRESQVLGSSYCNEMFDQLSRLIDASGRVSIVSFKANLSVLIDDGDTSEKLENKGKSVQQTVFSFGVRRPNSRSQSIKLRLSLLRATGGATGIVRGRGIDRQKGKGASRSETEDGEGNRFRQQGTYHSNRE